MKPKYNLSAQGMERLLKRLEEVASEEVASVENDLYSATVSTSFIESITKVTGMADVIDRNEQLTKAFPGLISMYGFESMYDLYMYAKFCDYGEERLTKKKDTSKLVPVKRKVVRNGKEMEMTIWEDPNKGGETEEPKDESGGGGRGGGRGGEPDDAKRHAREMLAKMLGGDKEVNPKEIAELKLEAKNMKGGVELFDDSLSYYLAVEGDGGEIVGIVGYEDEGEYLKMVFFQSNGEVSGVATRGFFELIKLALEKDKGVMVDDQEGARPVFERFELTQGDGGVWSVKSTTLKELLGKE